MGATVDLERVAPQWSTKYKDQEGKEKYRVATIDVVATIPRCDELQRSTDTANVEGAAKNGEYATLQGDREQNNTNIWEQERGRAGHCEAGQL